MIKGPGGRRSLEPRASDAEAEDEDEVDEVDVDDPHFETFPFAFVDFRGLGLALRWVDFLEV